MLLTWENPAKGVLYFAQELLGLLGTGEITILVFRTVAASDSLFSVALTTVQTVSLTPQISGTL